MVVDGIGHLTRARGQIARRPGHNPSRCAIVAGYIALDEFIVTSGATPLVRYGGSAANFAVLAAAMGIEVALLSAVGSDNESEEYLQYLLERGISTDLVLRTSGGLDRCQVCMSTGKRQWIPGAARAFANLQIPTDPLRESRWIHVAQVPQSIVEQIRLARLEVGLSFNPGPSLLTGTIPARYCVELPWRFLFLNQTEARFLESWYGKPLEQLVQDEGVSWVFVTRGAAGVLILGRERSLELPPLPAVVVDPTGAGDAYAASVVSFHLQGLNITACACLGLALAAVVVEGIGGQWRVPTREEVLHRAGIN